MVGWWTEAVWHSVVMIAYCCSHRLWLFTLSGLREWWCGSLSPHMVGRFWNAMAYWPSTETPDVSMELCVWGSPMIMTTDWRWWLSTVSDRVSSWDWFLISAVFFAWPGGSTLLRSVPRKMLVWLSVIDSHLSCQAVYRSKLVFDICCFFAWPGGSTLLWSVPGKMLGWFSVIDSHLPTVLHDAAGVAMLTVECIWWC